MPLFRLLCLRGIGVVFISLYSNFMMSLGKGRAIVVVEIVKDATTAVALLATVFSLSLDVLVWGQVAATAATWIASALLASRATGYPLSGFLRDLCPFISAAAVAALAVWLVPVPEGDVSAPFNLVSLASLAIKGVAGVAAVLIVLKLMGVPELKEFRSYIAKR